MEVLVGTAITVTVITVMTSVLIAVMAGQNRMMRQTEQAETLRIAASWITRDARTAVNCVGSGTSLRLVQTWDASQTNPVDWVDYKFTKFENGAEVPDPNHLHRWEYQRGTFIHEDLVGWELAPPVVGGRGSGTRLSCSDYRRIDVYLQKQLAPGQVRPLRLNVTAYQRSG